MANLKDDLDDYLLSEERRKTGFKLNFAMPKMPSFGSSSATPATPSSSSNSWLNDDDGWCPKLNKLQRYANADRNCIIFYDWMCF